MHFWITYVIAALIGIGWVFVSFWSEPLFLLGSIEWLILTIVVWSSAACLIYFRTSLVEWWQHSFKSNVSAETAATEPNISVKQELRIPLCAALRLASNKGWHIASYEEDPQDFAAALRQAARDGLILMWGSETSVPWDERTEHQHLGGCRT